MVDCFMQGKLDLSDLIGNKKFKFRIIFKPTDARVGTRFKIDFIIDENFLDEDVIVVNGNKYGILFDISKGELVYQDLIQDVMQEQLDLIQYDCEVKLYKVFLAMINPIMLLSLMNEHDVVSELIVDDMATLEFEYFNLEIQVVKDRF